MRIILFFLFFSLLQITFGQSPGAVSVNLELWLKADAGVEELAADPAEIGDNILNWLDQSGNGNDFTQDIGTAPTYTYTNGRNTIDFSAGSQYLRANSVFSGTGARTMIMIVQPTSLDASASNCVFQLAPNESSGQGYSLFMEEPTGTFGLACRVSGNRVMDYTASTTTPTIFSVQNGASENVSATEFYANGTAVTSQQSVSAAPLNSSSLGCIIGGFSSGADNIPEATYDFNGSVSEIIVYSQELSNTDRNSIESYMNIRYGITIPVASHDFYTQINFPNDIAGIGRNLITQDFSKDSAWSINPETILTIYEPSSLDNEDYLVWGNDGGSNSFVTTDIPLSVDFRLERIWRTTETNDIGTVTLKFYLPGINDCNSPIAASNIKLLVDNTDTDFSDASITAGTTYSNDTVYFTAVNLNNNDHFTIGIAGLDRPADVSSDLELWLKADCGVEEADNDQAEITDGILNWLDQSGKGRNVINSAGSAPVYSNIGGDSTIDFSGGSSYLIGPSSFSGTGARTILVVARPTSLSASTSNCPFTLAPNNTAGTGYSLFLEEVSATSGLACRVSGNRIMNYTTSTASPSIFVVQNGPGESVSATKFFVNGDAILEEQSLSNSTLNTNNIGTIVGGFAIGGTLVPNSAHDFNGYNYEILVYSREIDCSERKQLELYLAEKYSIELDYFDETATGSNGISANISGILKGYENYSDVNSITSGGLTISNNTFLTDAGDAIYIANDASSGIETTDIPVGIDERELRVWFADYTSCASNTGNITLSFNLSASGCTPSNSPVNASNYRLLTSPTNDFTAATATSGATIVGDAIQFTVNSTVIADNFISIGTTDNAASPSWTTFSGPAAIVSGLQLWLYGDCGVEEAAGDAAEHGDNIAFWRDQSGNGNDLNNDIGGAPTFNIAGSINSVDFSAGSNYLRGNSVISGTEARTVFLVVNANSLSAGSGNVPFSLAPNDGSGTGYGISLETPSGSNGLSVRVSGNKVINYTFPTASIALLSTQAGVSENVTDVEFFVNGESAVTVQSSAAAALNTNSQGTIVGGWSTDGDLIPESTWDFDGSVYEIIVYNRELSCTEREQIEFYLSDKYGFTLKSEEAEDIGDNGIGTDPVFIELSNTAAVSSALTISNSSFITDCIDTLWVAHNNLSGITAKADDADMVGLAGSDVKRWTRFWYGLFVSNETNPANITLTFDLDDYPASSSFAVEGTEYRLITSSSPWSYATTISGPTLDVPNNTVSFVVDADEIQKRNFTLATTDNLNSPLPIELLNFNVTISKGVVTLNWSTAGEINNDYFTINRSDNGEDWEQLTKVVGSGNSNKTKYYRYIDNKPIEGYSYYQLTQFDYDGQSTTYPPKPIWNKKSTDHTNLKVFPNPTENKLFIEWTDGEPKSMNIFTLGGIKVNANKYFVSFNNNRLEFNFSDLSQGKYIIEIEDKHAWFVKH